jgi:hypothetical protein
VAKSSVVWRTAANSFDHPGDFRSLLKGLLGYAVGQNRNLVINFPAAWRHELDRAARELVPELRRGRNYYLAAWRIYGKLL